MTMHLPSFRVLALSAAFAAGFGVSVFAGPQQIVTLRDASVVRGEILEMKNGQYRIKSPALGELKVPLDQVVSIVSADAPAVSQAPASAGTPVRQTRNVEITIREGGPKTVGGKTTTRTSEAAPAKDSTSSTPSLPQGSEAKGKQEQVNSRVQSMMMNEDFFEKVTSMGQSPEMDQIMNDPEVMQAIQNLDYDFLMNNPKMKELMESEGAKGLLGGGEE